uniref:SFRICE_008650 n=1 Tax=Spodoptera frugiperda TaxID=7108 RepID=A0A2H1V3N9_SPOFR
MTMISSRITISTVAIEDNLCPDAARWQDAVAIDLALEDCTMRGYMTDNVNMHVVTVHSAKATALHEPKAGVMKQAWLFSAPDAPTTT